MDTLVLVKGRGKGRGFEWRICLRVRDRGYILMWRELLMKHLDRLELLLESMGDTFVEPEIHNPPTTKTPLRTLKPWITHVSVLKTHVPKVSYGS